MLPFTVLVEAQYSVFMFNRQGIARLKMDVLCFVLTDPPCVSI